MSSPRTHAIAAAKFDFEYLGKSTKEIASNYDFPLASLEEEIEIADWNRKIAPTELPDTSDMQLFADQLEKITRSKLSIISLFRQIENQSLYAELEKEILRQALTLASALDSTDDKAPNKLMNITKTLTAIQERNPIQLADSFKETLDGASNQVIVNIANQIQ